MLGCQLICGVKLSVYAHIGASCPIAHTVGPRDISGVCIALAYRQVVRIGASWPVLFTCLCLHTHSSLQPLPFRCLPSLFFSCSHGRTSEHAAASWHHRVESPLLHGHSALRTTLSPTATMWCDLPAVQILASTREPHGAAPSSSVSCPQFTHSANSPQVQTGPTRTATSDLMSASLAEAATQLSFAVFLERCILFRASPPLMLPTPTLLLDAATQTIPHIAVSQDVSTQVPLAEFSLRWIHLQDPSGSTFDERRFLSDVFPTHPSATPRLGC